MSQDTVTATLHEAHEGVCTCGGSDAIMTDYAETITNYLVTVTEFKARYLRDAYHKFTIQRGKDKDQTDIDFEVSVIDVTENELATIIEKILVIFLTKDGYILDKTLFTSNDDAQGETTRVELIVRRQHA